MVVTHHPFDVPEKGHHTEVVGRADMAMKVLAECGADVLLAGHLHTSHIGHTATRYKIEGHSALVIQAGTATSTRERGERNSFNLVYVEHPAIAVERFVWEESGVFSPVRLGGIPSYVGRLGPARARRNRSKGRAPPASPAPVTSAAA